MHRHRLPLSVLFLAILAGAVASIGSGADAPATFRLARISSHMHQEEPGAVQDSHWSLMRKADPADPCGVSVTMKGSQRITFGLTNLHGLTNRKGDVPLPVVLVTFHPDGRLMSETWPTADISRPGTITSGTFEVPATVTRKAEVEIGKPSAACVVAGDGVDFPALPVEKGGCGTAKGKMHLHLSRVGTRLRVTGHFVSIFGRNVFSRCLLFPEHYPTPPEKRLELVDTSWPICETILEKPSASGRPVFDPAVGSVDIGSVGKTDCDRPGVVTRRKGGATVSSYWMWLNRVKHDPIG